MSLIRVLIALVLGCGVLLSGEVFAEDCQLWQERRPYVQKFFEVEGQNKINLVQNFNVLLPRTYFEPDMVGYGWFGGEKVVRLYMVSKGCVILDRYLPRKAVWQMMSGQPADMVVDKSGATYSQNIKEHNAARDEAWQQGQIFEQQLFEEDEALSEEQLIIKQDVN